MRICDVTQFYSPFGGGVKRYLSEKQAYVRDQGRDEHVLIIPGPADAVETRGRCQVVTIASPPVSGTSRYRILLRTQRLREVVREAKPDIIESGDPYHVAWVAIEEARRLGVPVCGFYHSHFPEAYLRTAARFGGPGLERAVLRRARDYVRDLYTSFDATLVCAEPLRRVLTSWGVHNVRAMRLGADMAVFRPGPPDAALRKTLGARAQDEFLLLYVGRLVREKNVPTLLAAFRELLERPLPNDRRWRLVVVGQGPLLRQVQALEASTRAVSWIPAMKDKEELARLYRTCDLVVHPSVNETFGLVPVEAQACGRLVAGLRGGNLELNIRAGLDTWAARNTPAGLAGTVRALAAIDRRPLEQAVAKAVREEFSWPKAFDQLWSVYRELLTSPSAHQWLPRI